MAGVINTGVAYQNRALSGFIRQSANEAEIKRANDEIDAREKAARKSNQATMTVAGGMAGAAYGAELGMPAGPYGAIAGAALGFLFGSLF